MFAFIKKYKRIFIKLLVILIFLTFLITLIILKSNVDICETWTRSFSRFYQSTLGWVYKYIPFSLTEWLFIALLISGVTLFILFLINMIKRHFCKGFNQLANLGVILTVVFSLSFATFEMAYNRAPLPINLYEEKVNKTEYRKIIDYFVTDLNFCAEELTFGADGNLIMPCSLSDVNKMIEEEYKVLDGNDYFTNFTTYGKNMVFSFLFREFHITGITTTVTTEANINTLQTVDGIPFTVAHEIAHTKGVAREEDANLLAAYICLQSKNVYLRYSGYVYTIWSLLDLANYTGVDNEFKDVYGTLSAKFISNQAYDSSYWNSHRSLQQFAEWWNNLYLKASGEEGGTQSYNDSPVIIDPSTFEITTYSTFQKLYFLIYFKAN